MKLKLRDLYTQDDGEDLMAQQQTDPKSKAVFAALTELQGFDARLLGRPEVKRLPNEMEDGEIPRAFIDYKPSAFGVATDRQLIFIARSWTNSIKEVQRFPYSEIESIDAGAGLFGNLSIVASGKEHTIKFKANESSRQHLVSVASRGMNQGEQRAEATRNEPSGQPLIDNVQTQNGQPGGIVQEPAPQAQSVESSPPVEAPQRPVMGGCKLCGEKVGLFRRAHRECELVQSDGLKKMTQMVSHAVASGSMSDEDLRTSLLEVAESSFNPPSSVDVAIEEGWLRAVEGSFSDGILTAEEETRLREFRDRFVLEGERVDESVSAITQGAQERDIITAYTEAMKAALSTTNSSDSLEALQDRLDQMGFPCVEVKPLLIKAWEDAVERALEDGMLTTAEEQA